MPQQMKKKNWHITIPQDDFLKRKVAELKETMPPRQRRQVTEERVIQGMLDYYMAVDAESALDPPA